MKSNQLTGSLWKELILNGLKWLQINEQKINDLNVFPVPDGDTGTNMKFTLQNGIRNTSETNSVGIFTSQLEKGMLLGARGNSGVILSLFFKGLSLSLHDKDSVGPLDLVEALIQGYQSAYSAVVHPTEGTILTVAREGIENIKDQIHADDSIQSLLEQYCDSMKESLRHTPEKLAVLKEANVVDSGGNGLLIIFEGMVKYLRGERLEGMEEEIKPAQIPVLSKDIFNADSELEYGYCTEFILQLQNRKIKENAFDLTAFVSFLKTLGDSIVAVQDEDIVKIHIHTMTPGKVIEKAQEYGEFISFKMDNMSIQHHEVLAKQEKQQPQKSIAYVAVAQGEGVISLFQELGCDVVLSGGQTMNTSTEEFIQAFRSCSAHDIIVLPNNKNILLAAQQAKELYLPAHVHILETNSVMEGYFALSMLSGNEEDIDDQFKSMKAGVDHVVTISTTYAIRDTHFEQVVCQKGDAVSFVDHRLVAAHTNKIQATLAALEKVKDLSSKEICVLCKGKGASQDETRILQTEIQKRYPYLEVGIIEGEQEIYDFILGLS